MSAADGAARSLAVAAPRVFVEPSQELPLVHVSVALRSGSAEDPAGKEGLSRVTGRLMRRTAGGRHAEELDRTIDSLGGALGVDTGHSSSGLHGTVIARSLDTFVGILQDAAARPGFHADELERLQRETESEIIDGRDNDAGLARYWFRKKLYGAHPYARSSVGTISSVKSLTEADVRQHHARSWVRDNLIFAFAGDIDESGAELLAERVSRALPEGAALPDQVPEPTRPTGRHLVIVDKPERTQTQILIGCLGSHPRDEDHIPLHVANTVFGGTFTARLMREVRSKRGWSYGAYSSLPYDRRRRGFSMWTFPKAEDAAGCIRLELELLEELVEKGITKKELAWAKRYLSRSHAFALDTAAKRVSLKLDAAIYDLPEGYYETYLEQVASVTLEQANAALRRRLTPSDLLITVVGTESAIGDSVRAAIGELASSEVIPFDAD